MGEEADFIINQILNSYDKDYDDNDYQYDGVGLYEWRDTSGKVLKMHHMSTFHLSNAMQFAEPDKQAELFQTIKDRCGVSKNERITNTSIFGGRSMVRPHNRRNKT